MIAEALERLRAAADAVRAGWAPEEWTWHTDGRSGPLLAERRVLQDHPYVVFPRLPLTSGALVTIECDLPGESLELTVNSLYPITVTVDGAVVLDASGVPAASGPALIELGRGRRLRLDIRTPANAVPHIAPHLVPPWVWLHFTTASGRRRFDALDLAWARLHLADELAVSAEDRDAVARAAASLPADCTAATDAELDAVGTALAPLAPRAEAIELHLVGHAHIDLAWLWTWDDTVHVIERDVETVLALLDEYPEMCFTHSQPATYEVIRTRRPDLFERLRARVREGRWEPATAQWVESDTNVLAGESLARQLLEGVTWTREHLGVSPRVFLAPDTFGHSGNLPQLAASAGASIYYHHRCRPQDWPAYRWEGDDGTQVLGVTTTTYYGHITAGDAARAAVRAHGAGHRVALQLYGVCDHGGAPTRQSLEARRRLDGAPGLPRLRCSTLAGYAGALLATDPDLPVHRGESSITFPGCFTSRGDAKSMNRTGEAALLEADALVALAGIDRPELVDSWRALLFQQFHDILGGSSIAEVYDDQARAMEGVLDAAGAASRAALGVLGASDVVGASGGGAPPIVKSRDEAIEVSTERLHVVIDRGSGVITSVVDRPTGRNWLGAGGQGLNVLEAVEEAPVGMSAWNVGRPRSERSLLEGATTEVVEESPSAVVVAVVRTVGRSRVDQRITVRAGSDQIDVDTAIDWREPPAADGGIPGLKLGCHVGFEADSAWYETPFSATSRPFGDAEVPAVGWAALEDAGGNGVAVVADARHAYDATARRLRLRLVRSPYEPDPEADLRVHRVRTSYAGYAGGWRRARLAQRASGLRRTQLPLRSEVLDIEGDDTVVLATLKPARRGGGTVVRLYDAGGEGGVARVRTSARVFESTVVEDQGEELPASAGAVELRLRPFEVKTLLLR